MLQGFRELKMTESGDMSLMKQVGLFDAIRFGAWKDVEKPCRVHALAKVTRMVEMQ